MTPMTAMTQTTPPTDDGRQFPAMPLTDDQIDRLARRRASAKLGWYTHAVIYLIVNAGLFVLAHNGFSHRHWNLYPAAGWGLGLLLHGVSVFWLGAGSGMRDQLVERERSRLLRERR